MSSITGRRFRGEVNSCALQLEEAGAEYVDIARRRGGVAAMQRLMDGAVAGHPPFAPPFLKDDEVLIAQTANILLYLGRRHGIAPRDEAGRLWAHQLQLTIADVVDEAHDTHHPIASSLYYEDQQAEARRRAADFIANRTPKYLGYFERVLERNPQGAPHPVGRRFSFCDLSFFQPAAGLHYPSPRPRARIKRTFPGVTAL